MANTLRLKVFVTGRVTVETDGAVIDEAQLGGRQGRLLFAYLVAERSRPVPRDELAEALWGETPPATRDKALTVIASKLRGALADAGLDGRELLSAAFGCYRLDLPEGTWVDLLQPRAAHRPRRKRSLQASWSRHGRRPSRRSHCFAGRSCPGRKARGSRRSEASSPISASARWAC